MAANPQDQEIRDQASATLRYLRGSPQKVRLVVDQLRGKPVAEALSILKFSKKKVARDLSKLLKSAVANAEQHEVGDMEELVVSAGWVDEGPVYKRIRPAPMGRAFRYYHRTSHVTLEVKSVEESKPVRRSQKSGGRKASSSKKKSSASGRKSTSSKKKAAAKA